MADPTPPPGPSRPVGPVRSMSDSIPVDVYAQFGPRSREDGEGEDGKVAAKGRVSGICKCMVCGKVLINR